MAVLFATPRRAVMAATLSLLPLAAGADGHTDELYGAKGYVGDKGYVGQVAAPRPITKDHYAGAKYSTRVRHAEQWQVPGCPPNFSGMFRGTLYCVNGRPMQ